MLPHLPEIEPLQKLYHDFLSNLKARGFTGEITTSEVDRTVFATDNSIYRVQPQAVLFPRDAHDIARALRLLADERFASVVLAPRGGGTGTNGQALTDGVVLDLSRHMTRIIEINAAERWVRVEAGVVKDQLDAELEPYGLFFAPELSTSNRATIGGMIATDACGQGSCLYGKTRDHVLELTSVLIDGTLWSSRRLEPRDLEVIAARDDLVGSIHRVVSATERDHAAEIADTFPRLNRCLTGYDLAHIRDDERRFDLNAILCGAEGTLAVTAEAKLRVLPIPQCSALVNVQYSSFDAALRDAPTLMGFGAASIETVDSCVLALAREDIIWSEVQDFFPEDTGSPTAGANIIEFVGNDQNHLDAAVARLVEALKTGGQGPLRAGLTVASGKAAVERIWAMRKRAVGLLGNMTGERRPVPFIEDTAVPPENLANYIAELRGLLDARGLNYGMFGHVDAGVLHVRPALDMKDPEDEHLIRELSDEVALLTRRYGGLLWGEHGKGMRSEYSAAVFGSLYPLLQAIKATFDPRGQLNPGKVAMPAGAPSGILTIDGVPTRGRADRAISPKSWTTFAEVTHCNGNGVCFDFDTDHVMCPSLKATMERRHSPKGRAMLLREWLRRLSMAGTDAASEAEAVRAAPSWRSFPARARNTLARWRGEVDFSHAVKEALDGCLACKACAGACPIKVDIPSARSKFLEVYHGRYLRGPRDHMIARIERTASWLSRAPRLANAVTSGSLGRALLAATGLVDNPFLSTLDLKSELARRGADIATPAHLDVLDEAERIRSVIIVQDAFTSYYETQLVLDVIDLLLLFGKRPWLAPFRPNGKAMHVFGFLKGFARAAAANAAMLAELDRTGVPLIGIDPSMTLAYRAEYPSVGIPAPRVLLLQEWLARTASDGARSATAASFRLLAHCTERTTAATSLADWAAVFRRHGLHLDLGEVGCCGMAGTYGHEIEHQAISRRIWDQSWGRHIAGADKAVLLATGFSCRLQAQRFAQVKLKHPAQALLHALRDDGHPGQSPTRQPINY